MNISCFTDCDSESLVMRVPYELAVQILDALPNNETKQILVEKMQIASRRSSKFTDMLRRSDYNV